MSQKHDPTIDIESSDNESSDIESSDNESVDHIVLSPITMDQTHAVSTIWGRGIGLKVTEYYRRHTIPHSRREHIVKMKALDKLVVADANDDQEWYVNDKLRYNDDQFDEMPDLVTSDEILQYTFITSTTTTDY